MSSLVFLLLLCHVSYSYQIKLWFASEEPPIHSHTHTHLIADGTTIRSILRVSILSKDTLACRLKEPATRCWKASTFLSLFADSLAPSRSCRFFSSLLACCEHPAPSSERSLQGLDPDWTQIECWDILRHDILSCEKILNEKRLKWKKMIITLSSGLGEVCSFTVYSTHHQLSNWFWWHWSFLMDRKLYLLLN